MNSKSSLLILRDFFLSDDCTLVFKSTSIPRSCFDQSEFRSALIVYFFNKTYFSSCPACFISGRGHSTIRASSHDCLNLIRLGLIFVIDIITLYNSVMSKRSMKFASLIEHAFYSRLCARLTEGERALIQEFIHNNDLLDKNEFESAINRLFIDKVKPKNWAVILEALSVVNT